MPDSDCEGDCDGSDDVYSENDEDQENIPPLIVEEEMERRQRAELKSRTLTRCWCEGDQVAKELRIEGDHAQAAGSGSLASHCLVSEEGV